MKAAIYIFICLLMISCKKENPQEVDTPNNGYIWPTNSWSSKTPLSAGVNNSYLDSLNTKIGAGDYGDVHSLLIVKKGYLIFERYYNGSSANEAQQLQSATKSIASREF